ncbi:MAG: long-chain fatty acid--CoA ligase [Actinobacteria bacterium]|nr:long-chain fatty acid--CoA ligase [Actinomycetota bacterium]
MPTSVTAPDNLAGIIAGHPGHRVAIISRGRPTTYGELLGQVRRFRGALQGIGVTRGERVVIMAANGRHFVVAYLAVVGMGAVAVPLNPTATPAELEREINEVGAKAVVVGPSAAPAWARISAVSVPTVEHVLTADAIDDMVRSGVEAPEAHVHPDDLAVLIFTSGTAGAPRAAMLSHDNLLSNIRSTIGATPMHADDVSFGVLPMFHIFGLNVMFGCAMATGGTIVLVERFDPASAVETIVERSVTVMAGAPAMWVALAQMPGVDHVSMSTLRLAVTGAAKMPEDMASLLESKSGIVLAEGYGLTEASPVVTTARLVDGAVRSPRGSIGVAVSSVEIRIVDEAGDDALLGDEGEIWVKGPNVFRGYWNDDEATARVLTPDGWLRTGDIAVSDDEGNLFIVERAKDLIIVSGFNVYPAEVESVIAEHPGVRACAVVGVAHPHTGEAVKVFVVSVSGVHLDEESIIEHARKKLSRYKCPTKVKFVDELPVNVTGKVLRRALR